MYQVTNDFEESSSWALQKSCGATQFVRESRHVLKESLSERGMGITD